jgi:hypothetical protein
MYFIREFQQAESLICKGLLKQPFKQTISAERTETKYLNGGFYSPFRYFIYPFVCFFSAEYPKCR